MKLTESQLTLKQRLGLFISLFICETCASPRVQTAFSECDGYTVTIFTFSKLLLLELLFLLCFFGVNVISACDLLIVSHTCAEY